MWTTDKQFSILVQGNLEGLIELLDCGCCILVKDPRAAKPVVTDFASAIRWLAYGRGGKNSPYKHWHRVWSNRAPEGKCQTARRRYVNSYDDY